MKKVIFVLLSLVVFSQVILAEPCALVTNPRQIQFVPLKDVAKHLEKDLDLGKGITGFIGKKVISRRFRKAGIPDPAKTDLSYAMVGRETGVDSLNFCFIFKGEVNQAKFLKFASERYEEYFENLNKQKITDEYKDSFETEISGHSAVVFPFAFRESESVVLSFNDYMIIATVPTGNYELISDVVSVLEGNETLMPQDEIISYKTVFIPKEQERKEIKQFENRYEKLRDKVKKNMSKIMNNMGIDVSEKEMQSLEQKIKESMSRIEKFMYKVEAKKEGHGYSYQITMNFKCEDSEHASSLKELFLALLTNNASKNITRNDMVSYKSNKVTAQDEYFIYRINIGSSPEEQYQFSAMTLTLLMQDKRFNRIFKK